MSLFYFLLFLEDFFFFFRFFTPSFKKRVSLLLSELLRLECASFPRFIMENALFDTAATLLEQRLAQAEIRTLQHVPSTEMRQAILRLFREHTLSPQDAQTVAIPAIVDLLQTNEEQTDVHSHLGGDVPLVPAHDDLDID